MGWEFEVNSWEFDKGLGDYKWKNYYQGDDKELAFEKLHELKKLNHPCVEIKWR